MTLSSSVDFCSQQVDCLVLFFTKRIAAITSTLQKKLEAAFQEGLQTGELNLLSRVLRTYAIIDKTRDAEMLFREVTVKPYMSEVKEGS